MPCVYCVLCGNRSKSVSYFSFPKNAALCQEWMNFCGINSTVLNTATKLCSNHFKKEDIIHRKNRVVIKPGAVPYTIKGCEERQAENCIHEDLRNICTEENIASFNQSSIPTSEVDEVVHTPEKPVWPVNHIPDEAATADGIAALDQLSTPVKSTNGHLQSKTYRNPRYIGDIRSPHFATPRRARRAFCIVKRTVQKQQETIKSLQQTKRRLLNRINNMEGLIQHLMKKQLLDESTADNLLVMVNAQNMKHT